MAGKQARKAAEQVRRKQQRSTVQTASRPSRHSSIRRKADSVPETKRTTSDVPKETTPSTKERIISPRASIIREKQVDRSIKTASRSVRTTSDVIKTPVHMEKAAAQAARKSSEAAQTAVKAGKKAGQAAQKRAAKLAREALKAILAAAKSLRNMLGAGSAVVIMVLVVTLLVGMLLASPFGIFFRGADDSDMTIHTVIVELNNELTQKITDIENSVPHDDVRRDGHSAAMKDVLAVYAVKITTDRTIPWMPLRWTRIEKQF